MTARDKERGTALLNALLVTALAAALLAQIARRDAEAAARLEMMLRSDQARHHALAVELLAMRLLEEDAEDGPVDHLGEAWAVRGRVFEIEGATVTGAIADLQARLDLNAVAAEAGEAPNPVALAALGRLIAAAGGEPALAGRIAAWISAPEAQVAPAPGAPHRRFAAPSELFAVPGVEPALAAALAPYVAALSGSAPVNVNTAPAPVLSALGLAPSEVEALLRLRGEAPFESLGDLADRAERALSPLALETLAEARVGVGSDRFLLEVEAVEGRGAARLVSVIARGPDDGTATVLFRAGGLP